MPDGTERAADQYRRFVETGAVLPPADPLAKPYGGFILCGDDFVREELKKVRGERLAKTEVAGRRALIRHVDRDDVVRTVSEAFHVSKAEALASRTGHADARHVAIEAPCGKLQGIFEVQGRRSAICIRLLTPQLAAANALRYALSRAQTQYGAD
jgi:hypothetical protein